MNYSMNRSNLVFSHQFNTAVALAEHFENVTVFTPQSTFEAIPKNMRIIEVPWNKSSPALNGIMIITKIWPFLLLHRKAILFTHMVDVHAALISPLAKLLGMKHYFWYAHATNSFFLTWSSFFVTGILSSTPGSCNVAFNREKIFYLNQGIDETIFPFANRTPQAFNSIIYYGRLDESKNIHLLPSVVIKLQELGLKLHLDIYGKELSHKSFKYIEDLKRTISDQINLNDVNFFEPIQRERIAGLITRYDLFINLFSGSLDKALIEATLMGIPVVTWNREYCYEFGTWSKDNVSQSLDFIIGEILAIMAMSEDQLTKEIKRRLDLAITKHSFQGWINRVTNVLLGER